MLQKHMSLRLIGKKKGMTQIFDEGGKLVACTVIEIEPHIVAQVKTEERDGYNAVKLASIVTKESKLKKPQAQFFKKNQMNPKKIFKESHVANTEDYTLGQEIKADYFSTSDAVDVTGKSKGKGYQGVMKRHGARGMNRSHGAGPTHRHVGSTGSIRSHGRTAKNKIMAGHMGDETVTTENLRVLHVDPELNAIVVKGAIPGSVNSVVFIRKNIKNCRAK